MLEQLPNKEWVDLTQVTSIQREAVSSIRDVVRIVTRQGETHTVNFHAGPERGSSTTAAIAFMEDFGRRAKAAQEEEKSALDRLGDNLSTNAAAAGDALRGAAAGLAAQATGLFDRFRGGKGS